MMAKTYIEPATEEEEYQSIVTQDDTLRDRIQARRNAYFRYRAYVQHEISVDVIAPMRRDWIAHIYQQIPADLPAIPIDTIRFMVDSMLNDINNDYFNSVRKSILDYVLKNGEEKERLGIPVTFNPAVDYGSKPFVGIEPGEEWRNDAITAAMLMTEKLCIFSQATLGLMKIWETYEVKSFVKLPELEEMGFNDCKSINEFVREQGHQMNTLHATLINEWNKRCVDILREEKEKIDKDQTKSFFESVATLMANQVRGLITKSVHHYVDFFKRFKKEIYPLPEEVILPLYISYTFFR